MANGWTPERQVRQAEMIIQWLPVEAVTALRFQNSSGKTPKTYEAILNTPTSPASCCRYYFYGGWNAYWNRPNWQWSPNTSKKKTQALILSKKL